MPQITDKGRSGIRERIIELSLLPKGDAPFFQSRFEHVERDLLKRGGEPFGVAISLGGRLIMKDIASPVPRRGDLLAELRFLIEKDHLQEGWRERRDRAR